MSHRALRSDRFIALGIAASLLLACGGKARDEGTPDSGGSSSGGMSGSSASSSGGPAGSSSGSSSSSGGPSSSSSGSGGSSSSGSSSVTPYCPGLEACPPIAGCSSDITCENVDGCNLCECSGTEWSCTDVECLNPACPPQPIPGAPCASENQLCVWQDTQCACSQGTWTCLPTCPQPSSCPASQPAQYSPCSIIGLGCPYASATCYCMGPGTWFCNQGAVDGG
jgi:hypothetical protein